MLLEILYGFFFFENTRIYTEIPYRVEQGTGKIHLSLQVYIKANGFVVD